MTQRQPSTQQLPMSTSPSMNYLLANCFNFDQISNLKNHDGIKKKNNVQGAMTSKNPFGGNNGSNTAENDGAGGSAISGFATDRRPIKMRNFGLLKGAGG